jgi:hypothetical protein
MRQSIQIHTSSNITLVDAEKAREKIPGADNAEKFGKDVGKQAGANIDDAVSTIPHVGFAKEQY